MNSAGILVNGDTASLSVEDYDRCMDINTKAAFVLTQVNWQNDTDWKKYLFLYCYFPCCVLPLGFDPAPAQDQGEHCPRLQRHWYVGSDNFAKSLSFLKCWENSSRSHVELGVVEQRRHDL